MGLDVARCVALVGMVATHLNTQQLITDGRAAALFAVLAGVSLALMTGRQVPVVGSERRARSVGLAVRAVLIALIGLCLGEVDSGLAVVLTYYGLLFLLGIGFVGLRARALFVLAAVGVVLGPVVSQVVRPELPPRGYDSPTFAQLADPLQLLGELAFTGYYPVVPWLAYLLVGLALGRLNLARRVVQVRLLIIGVMLVLLTIVTSRMLLARPGVAADVRSEALVGRSGATPTGGSWDWLLVVAPHSSTPFDVAQTIGSALLVIGLCLLVVGALSTFLERVVAVVFGAGTMTLTLYSLHVILRTDRIWPPDTDAFAQHALVLLAIGALFVAFERKGPLELLVRAAATRAQTLRWVST